jgi:manganese/zinc/iron transport system ATP- binding protein
MEKNKKAVIEVTDLVAGYNKHSVLWKLNFHAYPGTLTGIVGPNGSGKSTLIKTIMNLIAPTSGSIKIYGEDHVLHLSKIAYVPQKNNISWDFPINVFDMVLMGRYGQLAWCQKPTEKDIAITWQALDAVKMTEHAHTRINELSGGQQQRICIARALAQQPEIYIMDEPFVAIDAHTELVLLELFQALKRDNKTIVVVHHNILTIKKYFDSVFFMNMQDPLLELADQTGKDRSITKSFYRPEQIMDHQP